MTVNTGRQTGQPHDLCYEQVFGGCESALELIECLKLEQAGAVMSVFCYDHSNRQRKMELKLETGSGIHRIPSKGFSTR